MKDFRTKAEGHPPNTLCVRGHMQIDTQALGERNVMRVTYNAFYKQMVPSEASFSTVSATELMRHES